MSEFNPLVQRVDALLKRHQQQVAAGLAPVNGSPEPVPPMGNAGPTAIEVVQPTTSAPDTALTEADETDIPVLTEIVDPEALPEAPALDPVALSAQIEAAVLEKLLSELDQSLDLRLGRAIGELLDQVMDGLRAELSVSVRQMVREAVAASVARALDERARKL